MFRVPRDAANPTYDDTIKVGLGRWLTSSAAERKEWMRRRKVADQVAARNRQARIDERLAGARAAADVPPPQPVAAPLDQESRTLTRLTRVNLWVVTFQLVMYVAGAVVVLAAIGLAIWLAVR